MLLALASGFTLSQAYRTVAAILALPLQAELQLTPQQLGVFAGTFHLAFGAMQLFMGVGIDVYGVRRTILTVFPLAAVGATLASLAPGYGTLLLAQALIGIGCAPAFLVCTVFIGRHFPTARFAAVSGAVMGLSGIGMLATGTPLAWVVEATSWRAGFAVLAVASVAAWCLIRALVHEPAPPPGQARPAPEPLGAAVRGFAALFKVRHTAGIVALALVSYASFIALRGLWLGPLLVGRHGYTLVDSGNAALAVSVAGILAAPLFGRLDPGPATRRRWIVASTLACAAVFAAMALAHAAWLDLAGALVVGVLSNYIVLQYADVRAAYPAHLTGRAMAVFTMAMFLGVALLQWLTGLVASAAQAAGHEPFAPVLGLIAGLLVAGAAAFALLPRPPRG
jgi:MFS family permease